MTTFSQLVDQMVLETRRADMRSEIASYLNQTIREVHFEPSRGSVVLYEENYQEALLTAVSDDLSWTIPRPELFQTILAARYDSILDEAGCPRYALMLKPGARLERERYVMQRAGRHFVFKGFGGTGATVSLSWYEYPPALAYFEENCRPAVWEAPYGLQYDAKYIGGAEADAEKLTTNWLLQRWATVLEEGIRAKVYKRLSDDQRARTSYSLYSQLRAGLYTSEATQTSGIY